MQRLPEGEEDAIREAIIRAGERAERMARRISDLIKCSDVPTAHWDEVSERVAEYLATHESAQLGTDGRDP